MICLTMICLTDDRNEQEKVSHPNLIGGLDGFMSGWGGARGVNSYAYWACADEHVKAVEKWVSSREEFSDVCTFKSVETFSDSFSFDYYDHPPVVQIYVVNENHRAVQKENAWVALTNQAQGH